MGAVDPLPARGRPAPLLVGRERELDMLRDHLAAAFAGHGGLVLIGGEAGIGKTTLVDALCHEAAQQGALVLIGRCYDLSDTPPYGPWLELFTRYPRDVAMPALPPAFAHIRTIGEVRNHAALFQQVIAFFAALTAQRPTVLLFDDLHWADPASLDLLRVVARHLAAWPLLILATYRSEAVAAPHPLYALIPALVREAPTERLDLRPLQTDDVCALVEHRYGFPPAGAAPLSAYVQGRAEGNPFFIGEILRTLQEEGVLERTAAGWLLHALRDVRVPALVRQVIGLRIRRLDEAVQRLLAIAAIIGQEVPLAVWQSVAESETESLLMAIEQAEAAHLISGAQDGTRVHFVHALIRETLYEGLTAARRRHWHQRAGEVLAAMPGSESDAVAYHFEQAGDERAVTWLVRAGERAYRAYAFVTAAVRFTVALQTMDAHHVTDPGTRGWILYRLAVVNRFVDPWRGIAYLDEALACAVAAGDEVLRAYVLLSRSNQHNLTGDLRQAFADYEASVRASARLPKEEMPDVETPEMWALAHPRGGGSAFYQTLAGSYAAAREQIEQAVGKNLSSPAQDVDYGNDGITAHTAAFIHTAQGRIEAARLASDWADETFRRAGQRYPAVMGLLHELHYIILPCFTDRIAERRTRTARAEEEYRRIHDVHADPHPQLIRLPLLVIEGDWDEARVLALRWIETRPVAWHRPFYAAVGALALAQGDDELVRRLIVDTFPNGPDADPGTIWFDRGIAIQRLATSLALSAGDLPTARVWLMAHDRWLAWSGAVVGLAEQALLWADWYHATGDRATATHHARRALACATEPRQPLALLAAHRLLGNLAREAGQYATAIIHLTDALALADACAAPYERARCLLSWVQLHIATGNHEAAGTLLQEARAIFASLGALPALARCDQLAGELTTAVASPAHFPDDLSAREIEVLRLIAQGMSNREIAAVLFISSRTVNRHIENVYRKIDAHNKADATAYALRHHLA